ncbi:MAG: CZB domain-containing protein [Myxococcota bacterium]
MDFDAAIRAHSRWKLRLVSYVHGPDQSLDPEEVGRDDRCDLGCWLHGDGARYAALPAFGALVQAHARFHRAAAEVVTRADQGEWVSSEVALGSSSAYERASVEVFQLLEQLAGMTR